MYSRKIKRGVFILEGLNSFAVTLYFYYFYFFTQKQFGFGNQANLLLAAASGLIYVPAAIFGGRFAQRAGYFTALKLGFALMIVTLGCGWLFVESAAGHIVVMLATTIGMCFTWPTLEALTSEGETYAGLQRGIGIYNVIWAGTGALAYFFGGAIFDWLGLSSMFYVPIAVLATQLAMAFWLERESNSAGQRPALRGAAPTQDETLPHSNEAKDAEALRPGRSPSNARTFLRMAWLANPFSYIAINTLIAVMPGIALRLGLSTAQAGFCASVWCFVRLGTFVALWLWPGWHYRFRWLLTAYLALMVTFATILSAPNLAILVSAQLALGVALGLIYYSSLFYSMDVGETKGEHGGIHEATIGLGNFLGPAVGAASLQLSPQNPQAGTWAVSALLALGLGGLVWLRARRAA